MGQGKVTGGLLDEPYPIKTRGDVNRARVLPMPRAKSERAAPPKAAVDEAPKGESEQPKGGFDYIAKRNKMMRGVRTSARRRSSTRNA